MTYPLQLNIALMSPKFFVINESKAALTKDGKNSVRYIKIGPST